MTLSGLSIGSGTLEPTFDRNAPNYTCTIQLQFDYSKPEHAGARETRQIIFNGTGVGVHADGDKISIEGNNTDNYVHEVTCGDARGSITFTGPGDDAVLVIKTKQSGAQSMAGLTYRVRIVALNGTE